LILTVGEIMMRLSPEGVQRIAQAHSLGVHYGGSEANVAALLSQLKHSTSFFTALPDSPLGYTASSSLAQYGVDISRIEYTAHRLGIYFLEKGSSLRPTKVYYDRQYSAIAEIDVDSIDWTKLFQNVNWLHWSGITPALSEKALKFTQRLLQEASRRAITISADLNFRANLWQYGKTPVSCMPELIQYCNVLSGGNEDSLRMLGIKVAISGDELDIEEEALLVKSRCEIWMEHFPKLRTIASTLRRSPGASHTKLAGALWSNNGFHVSQVYDIDPVSDRVGTGDAFMAGIIHGLIKTPDDGQQIVDFAVAASVLKHTIEGDVAIMTGEEILRLAGSESKSIRIQR
jgi:2-dehydro-3-deoxygluconokinase